MSSITSFLAKYAKFVTAAVGAAAVILPIVLGSTGTWVHYFQTAVAVLTALGVYTVPNTVSPVATGPSAPYVPPK